MKTFLSIFIPLSLVLPPLNQTLSAQEITNQNQLSIPANQTSATQEFSKIDQLSATPASTPSQPAPEPASSVPSPIVHTPATSSIAETPFPQAASVATTLTTIFNVLATLVHNTASQQTTTSSLSTLLESVFSLIAQTSNKKGIELDLFIDDLKKECRQSLTNTLEEFSTTNTLDEYKRPSKNEEKEAKAQAALCNVATIVTGVANIVQDPHDKVNVGQSVGSILAGIINIALLASHKPRQQTLEFLTETLNIE